MNNPFRKMSSRAIRVMYTIGALLVLAVCTARVLDVMVFKVTSNDQCAWLPLGKDEKGVLIKNIVERGVADLAGVQENDTLLAINGHFFKTTIEAQSILDSLTLGDYATYFIKRGDQKLEAHVKILKLFDINNLSLYLLGLGFLFVGYIVVMTKPQGYVQRLFARYGIFSMLLFSLFRFNAAGYPQWETAIFGLSIIVGRIFAPAMFIRFFLHFPVRKKILDNRWFTPMLYTMNILLLAALMLLNRGTPAFPGLLLTLAFYPGICFIVGLIVFLHSYFARVDVSRRNQLKPILIAVALGLATLIHVFMLFALYPFAIFLNPPLAFPTALLALVPLGFGYAIFRYNLMDIDLIVKRSLIYGAVTTSLAAIYLVTVVGLGRMFSYFFGSEDNKALSVVAFVIIAFVFDPIKRKAQESIDKIFYRERRNYQKALLEFSQELPRQINLDQVLTSMTNRIADTMHVNNVAVILCDTSEGCYSKSINIPAECCSFDDTQHGLLALLKRTKTAQLFALMDEEPELATMNEIDKKKIRVSGVILSLPMFLKDRMIGIINVGPKMSGKIYSQEDVDLLMTVGSQAAIAIENARLHVSEIEKQKIEEELKLAWKIQQGLLPRSNPSIPGLDIAGITVPAKIVGGDYYDFIQINPTQLLIVVADVSGKGISAALYMSKVQGMVQLAAQMYSSPKEILTNVNRMLYDSMERKYFITMIVALFDLQRGEVRICRAGHNKALIGYDGDFSFLSGGGIGMGLERGPMFESELEEVRRPLTPGQLFFFYTDGLTEAMDLHRNQFGEEAVLNLVRHYIRQSAVDLEHALIEAVTAFQGSAEQHDDITLLVVKTQ